MSQVRNREEGSYRDLKGRGQDVTKYPTMLRVGPPQMKHHPAQSISSAKIQNICPTQRSTKQPLCIRAQLLLHKLSSGSHILAAPVGEDHTLPSQVTGFARQLLYPMNFMQVSHFPVSATPLSLSIPICRNQCPAARVCFFI